MEGGVVVVGCVDDTVVVFCVVNDPVGCGVVVG